MYIHVHVHVHHENQLSHFGDGVCFTTLHGSQPLLTTNHNVVYTCMGSGYVLAYQWCVGGMYKTVVGVVITAYSMLFQVGACSTQAGVWHCNCHSG